MANLVTPDVEAGLRRDERTTILLTRPFKVTLQQIAALKGMDMSDLIRLATFEWLNHEYGELFSETYNRNLEYFRREIE